MDEAHGKLVQWPLEVALNEDKKAMDNLLLTLGEVWSGHATPKTDECSVDVSPFVHPLLPSALKFAVKQMVTEKLTTIIEEKLEIIIRGAYHW